MRDFVNQVTDIPQITTKKRQTRVILSNVSGQKEGSNCVGRIRQCCPWGYMAGSGKNIQQKSTIALLHECVDIRGGGDRRLEFHPVLAQFANKANLPLLNDWCPVMPLRAAAVVVVVVVEASAPKVYPRVTLVSASTLSGSVVRTLRGGEGLPCCIEPGAPP